MGFPRDKHGLFSADRVDFVIRYGMRCSRCMKVDLVCIQEPETEHAPWLCRECYTGMGKEQFQKNMDTISKINARRGVTGIYDKVTKTVKLSNSPVEEKPQTTDLFGGN
jgi:hypothetical protein